MAACDGYLEVGCGQGEDLEAVAAALPGLAPIVGVDWLLQGGPDRGAGDPALVGAGPQRAVADARCLPFRDRAFGVVAQVMLLSSVTGEADRKAVAAEVARVMRRGGRLVSIDLRYPGWTRRDRTALGGRRLRRLFPGWAVEASRTIGLLPPLARCLAPLNPALCGILSVLPPLRVYDLAVLRKPG